MSTCRTWTFCPSGSLHGIHFDGNWVKVGREIWRHKNCSCGSASSSNASASVFDHRIHDRTWCSDSALYPFGFVAASDLSFELIDRPSLAQLCHDFDCGVDGTNICFWKFHVGDDAREYSMNVSQKTSSHKSRKRKACCVSLDVLSCCIYFLFGKRTCYTLAWLHEICFDDDRTSVCRRKRHRKQHIWRFALSSNAVESFALFWILDHILGSDSP